MIISLRDEIKEIVGHDGYCATLESGKECDCDINTVPDQIITAVLKRLPKKKGYGYDQALDDMSQAIKGEA